MVQVFNGREQKSQGGIVMVPHNTEEGHLGRSINNVLKILPAYNAQSKAYKKTSTSKITSGNAIIWHIVAKGIQYKDFTEVSTDI